MATLVRTIMATDLALCFLGATGVAAQVDPPPVPQVDERVRGETRAGERFRGRLNAMSQNLLVVQLAREVRVNVPIDDLIELQVVRGQRRSRGKGAVIGLLIGGGVGVVGGALAGGTSSDHYLCSGSCAGEGAVILGVGLGVVGLALGAILGANADNWISVPLPIVPSYGPATSPRLRR